MYLYHNFISISMRLHIDLTKKAPKKKNTHEEVEPSLFEILIGIIAIIIMWALLY